MNGQREVDVDPGELLRKLDKSVKALEGFPVSGTG